PIAVAQSAEKAAGIVIRAAQVGSFQHRFFSRRPETEGEGGIFNTLLGRFSVKASHSSGPQFSQLISGSGRAASDVTLAIELG
ncbi:MAG: hypothetical protein ROZ37_20490, partial [Aromatoleum sp.]|uniref:hypothetical protein n=1 Tax=Aromatoleum sp. TaxID=2307007 RepID=UPI0028948AD7